MKKLINDGWRFCTLPLGSTAEQARYASWQEVDLPHDWLIWQTDRLYESADAWYQRILSGYELHAPVCMLRFDGVYMDCDVLLNGKLIASHPYGYTAFDADLTGSIQPGDNEILVHIRHRSPNTRWYSGSGIFRDVFLVSLPETHLIQDSLYAVCRKGDNGRWTLQVSAEAAGEDKTAEFHCSLADPQGNPVTDATGKRNDHHLWCTMTVDQPILWSADHPELYHLSVTLGEHTEERRIGFRALQFDPDHGLFVNGTHVKLKGVCLHHDLGALGAAFHEKAAARQLKLMKDMGVNAIRTSHNPPATKFLDLCDEMGFYVIDEAFDMWERPKTTYDYARFFPEHEAEDVASWIRRDRCHPCVIMWSIGNEIYDMQADARGQEVTRMLTEQVRQHDPLEHAKVTFGSNYMPWEGAQKCAEIVKIPGYNYAEKYYARHHAEHPDWVIYGSETASVLSSRGIYHFPINRTIMSEADLQCSALGNSNTSWGATDLCVCIDGDLNTPYSLGQFIWSGIDYIGEPTPYHTRSCYFGQADTACFPKDAFYLFKSLWNRETMIHIGVSWDWNPGQLIDVPVMTNCAEAELFLNDRSLGRKAVDVLDPNKCRPVWQVGYEPGVLRAAGYGPDGQLIAEEQICTPGDTADLALDCNEKKLKSDGWDMAFVTVSAVDKSGNFVANARDRFVVDVSGGGLLCGLDNGDSTDTEPYKTATRRLFSGKALIMLRSAGTHEDTRIRVTSAFGVRELTISSELADLKPGVSCVQRIAPVSFRMEHNIRKLEIRLLDSGKLTPEHPECTFTWKVFPADATATDIQWQVTNDLGVETPNLILEIGEKEGRVRACGDGQFYLRGMCGNASDHPEIISQIEIAVSGIGNPALDPYRPVSAGLYDIHEGDIGAGNEKGISFARDGISMAGFSRVDFGPVGSDRLTLPIFALDGNPYDMELLAARPGEPLQVITKLHYEKPSLWNVYQEESWTLPEPLTGIMSIAFRMDRKVHLKSFLFEKQKRTDRVLNGTDAEEVYGDEFRYDGTAIKGIGNNVTITFRGLSFDQKGEHVMEIDGATPLEVNSITVRVADECGNIRTEIANFRGPSSGPQRFPMAFPGGTFSLSLVFLPGSRFDFRSLRFPQKEDESES